MQFIRFYLACLIGLVALGVCFCGPASAAPKSAKSSSDKKAPKRKSKKPARLSDSKTKPNSSKASPSKSGELAPGESKEATSKETRPVAVKSNGDAPKSSPDAKSRETKSSTTKPGETKPGETKADPKVSAPKSSDSKSPDTKSSAEKSRERRAPNGLDRLGDQLPKGAVARLGTVRFRHLATPRVIQVSPDDETFFTQATETGEDRARINVLRLWELKTGRRLVQFNAFVAAYAGGGGLLAYAKANEPLIRIRNIETGKETHRLSGHQGSVTALAGSLDGKRLISAASDKQVKIWDLESGEPIHSWHGFEFFCRQVGFSHDGKMVFVAGDHQIKLFDADTARPLNRFDGHSAAFSPDDKKIAYVYQGSDIPLRCSELPSGRTLWKFKAEDTVAGGYCVEFTPDGKQILAELDDEIGLWNVSDGKPARMWKDVAHGALAHGGHDLLMVRSSSELRSVDLTTGKEQSLPPEIDEIGALSTLTTIHFTADGERILTAGQDGRIREWDRDGEILRSFNVPVSDVEADPPLADPLVFSPNGRRLARGSKTGEVEIYDVSTGKLLRSMDYKASTAAIVFTPDSKSIFVAGLKGRQTKVGETERTTYSPQPIVQFRASDGEELGRFKGMGGVLPVLTVSSDGATLAAGCEQKEILLWNIAEKKQYPPLSGTPGRVQALAMSPDNVSLAVAGTFRSIHFWLWKRARFQRQIALRDRLNAMIYSPDGKWLAGAGEDQTVMLWKADSGEMVRAFSGHEGVIGALAFSSDGKYLASGGTDGNVLVWEVPAR